jgi:hypothetical protein
MVGYNGLPIPLPISLVPLISLLPFTHAPP